MCGIAGAVDPRLSREEGEGLLGGMLASLRHRGPDFSSTWSDPPVWLGHNRLSIIDLSDLGHQPMTYDDLVIVHNGEIYNYLEIRAELAGQGYRFRSQSDTEVILAAYKAWGPACVGRFIGMWAFSIWDTTRRELFCSRDRFGIKPFYYIHAGDRFYFGSEYKPLKRSPLFRSDLNRRHVRRGLQVGAITYRDETYYTCLSALPERSNLVFRDGTVKVSRYWDIDGTRRFQGDFEDKRRRFAELFRDSVRLQMRSDVPVGGMLSGGLDSTSIASVVGTDFPDVSYRTFTIHYDGWRKMDERPWAEQVPATFANVRPAYFMPSDDEIGESYDAVVRALDTPVPDAPPVNCYQVMKAASAQKLKVMLDGQGADEYLAGYAPSFDRHIAGHLRRLQPFAALGAWNSYRHARSADLKTALRVAATGAVATLLGEQTLYLRHFRPSLSELLWKGVPVSLEPVRGSRLQQHAYHRLFGWFLPSLLQYGDRMSMAWSVESRVPFLDHRLVELAFSLDDDDLIREGQTKYILRRSLSDIVPEAILARQTKQAFSGGEIDHWLRGPLRFLTDRPLDLDGLGFLNPGRVAGLVRQFKDGNKALGQFVWTLTGLNYWLAQQ